MTHGSDILDFRGINIPVGGFLDAMNGGSHQIMPVVWTAACPSAQVTEDAFERIAGKIVEALNTPKISKNSGSSRISRRI